MRGFLSNIGPARSAVPSRMLDRQGIRFAARAPFLRGSTKGRCQASALAFEDEFAYNEPVAQASHDYPLFFTSPRTALAMLSGREFSALVSRVIHSLIAKCDYMSKRPLAHS
ncbi:hypothetical protein FA13DRAFT_202222 [Coprinellus micaceus]|uniref:Uncharacterized protein n=1 Tax=Coprinellus micaceus TaxID=71717 RepID=A0A4Y7SHU0_COPMI|nr:hypothetical protein FA13DRAFT_202222 [Coprinellus micaceus]